jgi:hypothetical protein
MQTITATLEGHTRNQPLLKSTDTQLVVLLLYRMKDKKYLEIHKYVQYINSNNVTFLEYGD